MATTTAPIKVDAETDRVISSLAHFTQTSKKSVVDTAIREYAERHRVEIQDAVLQNLKLLNGSTQSAVELMTGISAEDLNELGGFKS